MSNLRYACSFVAVPFVFMALATCAIAQNESGGPYGPYVADDCAGGYCVPNPANYGYYQTSWRRWPTSAPGSPRFETPGEAGIDSLPPAELPDPHFEGEITPPPPRGASLPRLEPRLPSGRREQGAPPPPPRRIGDWGDSDKPLFNEHATIYPLTRPPVAQVSWLSPFGTVPRTSSAAWPALPTRAEQSADDRSPSQVPTEPRRIQRPDLISRLPPVD